MTSLHPQSAYLLQDMRLTDLGITVASTSHSFFDQNLTMTSHAESPFAKAKSFSTGGTDRRDGETAYATNGIRAENGSTPKRHSHLQCAAQDELHDLVCIGFGPASLAIAVALHDALDMTGLSPDLSNLHGRPPKVAFLERQRQFSWHAGMLLPGAKMQITFIKDMATLRNPRSEFTFINYLHENNRLVEFTNLNTFLPQRIEYEDYMRWCASRFEDVVEYNQDVFQIMPEKSPRSNGKTDTFVVMSKNTKTGEITPRKTKQVVIAAGGRPSIPKPFPQRHPRVVHSSQFYYIAPKLLKDPQHPYKISVVGSGQSAAEIFDNLHSHYPNARTSLLIKGAALRPSDDSPLLVSFDFSTFNSLSSDLTLC